MSDFPTGDSTADQAQADADQAAAEAEQEQAQHDAALAADEENVAGDEGKLVADQNQVATDQHNLDNDLEQLRKDRTPPAPIPPTPTPTPGPDTPDVPIPDMGKLFEFIGADPASINRGLFVDSGLTDDSGNALYYYSADPATLPADWTEYDGPTQPKNVGSAEEQAARGVTNHGVAQ